MISSSFSRTFSFSAFSSYFYVLSSLCGSKSLTFISIFNLIYGNFVFSSSVRAKNFVVPSWPSAYSPMSNSNYAKTAFVTESDSSKTAIFDCIFSVSSSRFKDGHNLNMSSKLTNWVDGMKVLIFEVHITVSYNFKYNLTSLGNSLLFSLTNTLLISSYTLAFIWVNAIFNI